jgi:hypothetical protein
VPHSAAQEADALVELAAVGLEAMTQGRALRGHGRRSKGRWHHRRRQDQGRCRVREHHY